MRLVRAGKALRRTAIGLVLATLAGPGALPAQGFEDEVAFLTAPMGARIVGIGRAATSIRGEFQSVRWNPGVLASVKGVAPLASHYDGPLDFKFNLLAVAIPAGGLGMFAVAADVQSFGDIVLSDGSASGGALGTVTPNNLVVSLAFARGLAAGIAMGVTAKWIRSELSGDLNGDTFAFDAGLLWRPAQSVPLDLGLAVLNVGPGLSLGEAPASEASPLPSRLRVGASYDVLGHVGLGNRFSLLLAFDLEQALRDLRTGSQFAGAELGVAGILFLRGGYIAETLIETNTGATFGVGFALGWLRFDVARELGVNQLGDETHISLAAQL